MKLNHGRNKPPQLRKHKRLQKRCRTRSIHPLPSTPIRRCSTRHGPRPGQPDPEQVTTPNRATVTAEGTPGTEAINEGNGKIKLEGLNEKK